MEQSYYSLYHSFIIIRMIIKFMLREERGSVHESPLPEGVDSYWYADDGRSVATAALHHPTMVRLSGISELALLSWHPESVLPLSVLSFMDYDCGRCGSTSYLSAKGENKKSPQDSSSNLWGRMHRWK